MIYKGSEQTKTIPVTCRDCKETLTILATASSKIIEGRCPECTKAFNKAGEEYNKRIGFTVTLAPVGIALSEDDEPEELSDLAIHTLGCNGVFGLEWVLYGDISSRTVKLLQDGIRFCNNIPKTDESKAIKDSLLNTIMAINNHVNGLQSNITGIKGYKSPYNEQEIRRMQKFFNEQSDPYLRRQLAIMRKRHGW